MLTGKFVELSELMPENLDAPTTESTSFTIEGRSIAGADLGFFTHQSNAEVVSHARGVRGHALPGKF